LIRPIRDRRGFQRLAAEGRRIQRSNLWCIWCPDPHSPAASVAFAIGRTSGPAVARNRLRRRLRAVLREIDRATPIPPALLLFGTRRPATELTYEMIQRDATALIDEIRAQISIGPSTAPAP
jgi:ribonuclease P protein component